VSEPAAAQQKALEEPKVGVLQQEAPEGSSFDEDEDGVVRHRSTTG
jgi:hypothetical protein